MSDTVSSPASETPLLPIRSVTLFSSGVCYTMREGEVEAGEALVPLTFRTPQINDILKSLILLDPEGVVRAAAYPSHDPVGRTLQSFAVNVTHNLSRADLLRQLRGAAVTAKTAAGETLSGRIVGVEAENEILDDFRTILRESVTLLGEEGVQSVRLDRLQLLRLLDPRLDREFREALIALASGSDDNRRTLTLHFSGPERRAVQVGYIVEAPVWKVSYRLVLPDTQERLKEPAESAPQGDADEGSGNKQAAAQPYLQGWALVENTSDEDWNEVKLSLVSGRPISFIQDLFQPLYLSRPVVAPEIAASPYPQTHGGNLLGAMAMAGAASLDAPAPGSPSVELESRLAPRASLMPPMPIANSLPAPSDLGRPAFSLEEDSAEAQAEGRSVGEMFEYAVSELISLPRQQGAMIPIVAGGIEGEKLSLYNADRDPRFPLNAVRLKNTTSLHLKGGPITVFDGGVYAGDARMEEVPSGDSRLITYAVDLAVEGVRDIPVTAVSRTTLALRRSVLQISRLQCHSTRYTLKSKAKTARQVLVEHPHRAGHSLIEPKAPLERTADRYRFAVPLPPGETRVLTVTTEVIEQSFLGLLKGDLNQLEYHTRGEEAPAAIREAIVSIVARRREILTMLGHLAEKQKVRQTIHEEQERIRQNLAALDSQTPLYRRYLEELDRQETQLTELREAIEHLRQEANGLEERLNADMDQLEIV